MVSYLIAAISWHGDAQRHFGGWPLGAVGPRSRRHDENSSRHQRYRSARHEPACRPKQKTFKEFRVAVMLSDPVSEVDQPVQDLIVNLPIFSGDGEENIP